MRMNKVSAMISLKADKERLKPLTEYRPVAALPFACRFRIIDFTLSSISHAGIESVSIFIKESGRSLYDHIRSGREWNLDSSIKGGLFTYSQQLWKHVSYLSNQEQSDYYQNHRDFIRKSNSEYVVVIAGDIIHNIDLEALVESHHESGKEITVLYKKVTQTYLRRFPNHNVLVANTTGINSESTDSYREENLDLYLRTCVLKSDTLLEILDRAVRDRYFDDIENVLMRYAEELTLHRYEYNGHFSFVTNIHNYFNLNMAMLDKVEYNKLFRCDKSIITRSRSGVPTYYGDSAHVVNSQLATGCVIHGQLENAILFRKVKVDQGSNIKNSVILSGCKIGKNVTLDYVILDKDVQIDDGVILKGTPDEIRVIEKGKHITKEH